MENLELETTLNSKTLPSLPSVTTGGAVPSGAKSTIRWLYNPIALQCPPIFSQTPKTRSQAGNTSKHKQAAPCLKGDDSEKVSCSMISDLPDAIQKSNEIAKGVLSRTPEGINSVIQRLLDDFINRDYGVTESLLGQLGARNCEGMSSSSKTSCVLNSPTSVHKALQSALAFAAEFESDTKLDRSLGTVSDMNELDSSTFRG